MKTISSWTSFGGELAVFDHDSAVCGCEMRFAVFTPPQAKDGPVPVLWYLSGLTCNWSNVMEKSGLQRVAAELGLMVIAPDTSPRGEAVPNDDGYDLGQGAGFYLSATQAPWSQHFHMDRYIVQELSALIEKSFAADMSRQGITGHSMGGHGALTLHLKNPKKFRSVSAFSPIVAPMDVPWGQKAFYTYLGDRKSDWEKHDSCALVRKQPSRAHILVDQGLGDQFLDQQLRPDLLETACAEAGQALTLRRHEGYDHSYYFIASFIEDHLRHHAAALNSL
ncbi:S-formylglutathione hydrolase [Maricaulis sp.]|uniref:S-formylglutathione hydrolase n=1 Tax=Maricaulis sp. TaxID=1486257 RepID=UPI001B183443|nr:S-formylglutathione hydrolase [Maricaulis sp.]MBO6797691.1 S-formylglutathione hydrolase [Maricaulis sp.]